MKISVVTAVYNTEATVAEAIASVARQSHRDLEHLIVEGCSTDGSLAAIEAARHPRMILTSEPDRGLYDALNKGLRAASGEVVGLVHSDDFLADDTVLARVAAAFADPAVEAVFADLDYVAAADPGRVVRRWIAGPFDPARLRRGWMPPHPTLYLRRSVFDRIGGFDTGYRIAADYDFVLRYFSRTAATPVYLPGVIYKMRMGGVSNRSLGHILRKSREDLRALRGNGIGGLGALAAKNLSKLGQFSLRRRS